jgi:hypothetical protein
MGLGRSLRINTQRCGLAGVGFATVLLLGTIAVLLYRLVVNACGNEVLSFFVTAFALCGSSIHWLARPHLFSWLFFLNLSSLVASGTAGVQTCLGQPASFDGDVGKYARRLPDRYRLTAGERLRRVLRGLILRGREL